VQFAVGMMKELNNLLGIQTKLLMAYHPQTNRQMERINQELYKGDWGTRLQENPQLILQFVIMIQLTSRRILRD